MTPQSRAVEEYVLIMHTTEECQAMKPKKKSSNEIGPPSPHISNAGF